MRLRAVELAALNGRGSQDTTKADWEQAKGELNGSLAAMCPAPIARTNGYAFPLQSSGPGRDNAVVAIYPSHALAEAAVNELQHAGFDMKRLSIVGRDYHTDEHVVGYYNAGDRMKSWGKTGAFWGGVWGLLFGSAFFFVPGIGPLVMAGPLVSTIAGALEGALVVGGLSALGAGLVGLGIPENSIIQYETALKTDKYLLIAHGPKSEVCHAKDILSNTRTESTTHHQ